MSDGSSVDCCCLLQLPSFSSHRIFLINSNSSNSSSTLCWLSSNFCLYACLSGCMWFQACKNNGTNEKLCPHSFIAKTVCSISEEYWTYNLTQKLLSTELCKIEVTIWSDISEKNLQQCLQSKAKLKPSTIIPL